MPLRLLVLLLVLQDATFFAPKVFAATILAHPNSTVIQLGPQGTPKHAGSAAIVGDHPIEVGMAFQQISERSIHDPGEAGTREHSAEGRQDG